MMTIIQWRSQEFVLRRRVRNAVGVERGRGEGWEWGSGIPLPSRLGVVSSLSGVGGGASAENGFWCILILKNKSGDDKFDIFVIFIAHI